MYMSSAEDASFGKSPSESVPVNGHIMHPRGIEKDPFIPGLEGSTCVANDANDSSDMDMGVKKSIVVVR
jgi:hypothetical protein